MKIASTLRSRLPRHAADLLRPRLLWIVMAVSALAAAGAIQQGIDRVEAASAARAELEREATGLHERYLAAAAPTTPALQKLRAEHDAAVASAASRARATVWIALLWMMGLGAAGAWRQQRRSRAADAAAAGSAPDTVDGPSTLTVAVAHGNLTSAEPGPDWQALRQEIHAIGELIGADGDALPASAELHRLPTRTSGREPLQLPLRLAA